MKATNLVFSGTKIVMDFRAYCSLRAASALREGRLFENKAVSSACPIADVTSWGELFYVGWLG